MVSHRVHNVQVHVPYYTYSNETEEYLNGHVVYTEQFLFHEDFYKQITTIEPDTQDKHRRVHNHRYHDYNQDPTATLNITYVDNDLRHGVVGRVTTIVDPSATPTPAPMMDPKDFDPAVEQPGFGAADSGLEAKGSLPLWHGGGGKHKLAAMSIFRSVHGEHT